MRTFDKEVLGARLERRMAIGTLLRPYQKPLAIALLAVVGEGIANLLQPWPLKIVFDLVDGSKPKAGSRFLFTAYSDLTNQRSLHLRL